MMKENEVKEAKEILFEQMQLLKKQSKKCKNVKRLVALSKAMAEVAETINKLPCFARKEGEK